MIFYFSGRSFIFHMRHAISPLQPLSSAVRFVMQSKWIRVFAFVTATSLHTTRPSNTCYAKWCQPIFIRSASKFIIKSVFRANFVQITIETVRWMKMRWKINELETIFLNFSSKRLTILQKNNTTFRLPDCFGKVELRVPTLFIKSHSQCDKNSLGWSIFNHANSTYTVYLSSGFYAHFGSLFGCDYFSPSHAIRYLVFIDHLIAVTSSPSMLLFPFFVVHFIQ